MGWLKNKLIYLILILLIVVPLYPKFPLVGVGGTFVSIRLEDILIALVLSVTGLVFFKEKLKIPKVGWSIILYWLAGFVAIFSAITVTKTVSVNLGLLHWARRVEYMSMFLVGFWCLRSLKDLDLVVRVFLAVSAMVGLYGLGQQFLGFPVISTTNSEFAKGLALSLGAGARINSTFAGHYDLAAFSIFPLLLIVGLLMSKAQHKWILTGVGMVIYYAMLLSASRVTFVAFFATAALFIWLMKKRWWLIPLGVVAVVSIIISPQLLGRYREFVVNHLFSLTPIVQAAVDDEVPDALKPTVKAEDRSFNIRVQASWPRALRAFYKNPLLGTGFSSVGLAVDNDYLRSLAEVGLLGTLAMAGIFFRIYRSSFRVLSNPTGSLANIFIISVTCGLMGLMVNAVFIDVFEASKVAIVAWLLLGISEKVKTLTV